MCGLWPSFMYIFVFLMLISSWLLGANGVLQFCFLFPGLLLTLAPFSFFLSSPSASSAFFSFYEAQTRSSQSRCLPLDHASVSQTGTPLSTVDAFSSLFFSSSSFILLIFSALRTAAKSFCFFFIIFTFSLGFFRVKDYILTLFLGGWGGFFSNGKTLAKFNH